MPVLDDNGQYIAEFTGGSALLGGDLNDDDVVDILDFGIYVWQFAASYGSGDTDCSMVYEPGVFAHADISGSGVVEMADFTFISTNFLLEGEAVCESTLLAGREAARARDARPMRRVSVDELTRRRLNHLAIADLNGDGWIDETDIALWLSGVRP